MCGYKISFATWPGIYLKWKGERTEEGEIWKGVSWDCDCTQIEEFPTWENEFDIAPKSSQAEKR